MNIKQNIAKFFSLIFHPLLLPTFATVLIFILPTYVANFQAGYKNVIVQIVFLATFISPVLLMLILVNLKAISSIYLFKQKERNYPFAIVIAIYIFTFILLKKLPLGLLTVPNSISNFILISAIIILVTLLVNLKTKVSAHMAGIGGFISYFYVFFIRNNIGEALFSIYNFNITTVNLFSFLIIIAGIIASSRLYLKAHSLSQIYIGLLIGMIIGLMGFVL